jgi:UDP-N-acetylglucosamine acyltransferase
MVSGNTAEAHGLNSEGLRRRGFSANRISELRRAYRTLYKSGLTLQQAIDALREQAGLRGIAEQDPLPEDERASIAGDMAGLVRFLETVSRGIVR